MAIATIASSSMIKTSFGGVTIGCAIESGSMGLLARQRWVPRQRDRECRPTAEHAGDVDRAVVRLDELLRDVQADAESAAGAGAGRLGVALEDPWEVLGRDPHPVVDHLDARGAL